MQSKTKTVPMKAQNWISHNMLCIYRMPVVFRKHPSSAWARREIGKGGTFAEIAWWLWGFFSFCYRRWCFLWKRFARNFLLHLAKLARAIQIENWLDNYYVAQNWWNYEAFILPSSWCFLLQVNLKQTKRQIILAKAKLRWQ